MKIDLCKIVIAVLLISVMILIAKITTYETRTYLIVDGMSYEVYKGGELLYEFHAQNCDSSQIDLLRFIVEK